MLCMVLVPLARLSRVPYVLHGVEYGDLVPLTPLSRVPYALHGVEYTDVVLAPLALFSQLNRGIRASQLRCCVRGFVPCPVSPSIDLACGAA